MSGAQMNNSTTQLLPIGAQHFDNNNKQQIKLQTIDKV
jgi:hypothetical protein